MPRILHLLYFFVVAATASLLAFSTWLAAQKELGWRRIIRCQRVLNRTLPWGDELLNLVDVERGVDARLSNLENLDHHRVNATACLRMVLNTLNINLECGMPPWAAKRERHRAHHERMVYVMVPDEGSFRFLCSANEDKLGAYQSLRAYRPRMHSNNRHQAFRQKWAGKRPTMDGWREYYNEKATTTSLHGAVWAKVHDTDHAVYIEDIEKLRFAKDPFLTFDHAEVLPEVRVRTLYIRPLIIGAEYIGLLTIIDPVVGGLYFRDADLMDAALHLAEVALYRLVYLSRLTSKNPWE